MKKRLLIAAAPVAAFVSLIPAVALTLAWYTTTRPEHAAPVDPLDPIEGRVTASLASAPHVPAPIIRDHATRVVLDVVIKEHVKELADGVTYTYWTFGDETPGKFIRVREGDMVEVRLNNHPDNSVAHNIDFHSATGPGGGGEASFIAPGHSATFSWRAMRPGLYLYHCVAAPAGLHIANGMYGQILVEPKGGLPKVDREFQVVQGEFYTEGKFGERGQQSFSMEKAVDEEPEYVVFNGQVGALMGEKALEAKAGERIRVYLSNAGPSLLSSFHIVGEIFDNVYGEGGIVANQHNVQTTVVPVGGSAMVEFTVDVPGEYTLVDHSMFRAFNKGAMGMLKVTGRDNPEIFTGRTAEGTYNPGTHLTKTLDSNQFSSADSQQSGFGRLMTEGAHVYANVCVACHQSTGLGIPGAFPPLAQSDFLMADKARAIAVVAHGLKGPIVVNGQNFNSEMPKPPLTDHQIAAVLTYVRNHFGNQGDAVTVADVAAIRQSTAQVGPIVATEADVAITRRAAAQAKDPASAPSADQSSALTAEKPGNAY